MNRILGINDDVTTCECCGKSGLKKTVVIQTSEFGIVHYGSQCAAKKLAPKGVEASSLLATAMAKQYATKWIAAHGNAPEILERIANFIRCKWTNATVEYSHGGTATLVVAGDSF